MAFRLVTTQVVLWNLLQSSYLDEIGLQMTCGRNGWGTRMQNEEIWRTLRSDRRLVIVDLFVHWVPWGIGLGVLMVLSTGCYDPGARSVLIWDLSKSTDIQNLSGGKWYTPQQPVYYIDGSADLHLSIILWSGQRYDFAGVRHIYVDRVDSNITKIQVASYGHSKQQAIDHLNELHLRWNGMGIGDVDKWKADTDNGSLRRHYSIIHPSQNMDDPSVGVGFHYNFGGEDNAWFLMTTFRWPDSTLETVDEESSEATAEESSEQFQDEAVSE